MTYFHTGCSTIIGAKSFHGPVRDGKGWDRLAIVIRHDLLTACSDVDAVEGKQSNLEEVVLRICFGRDAQPAYAKHLPITESRL